MRDSDKIVACRSCGHPHAIHVGPLPPGIQFGGRPISPPLPGGDLYACPACFLRFRHPLLPQDRLNELYRRADPNHWQYEAQARSDWGITLEWLETHLPPGSILDLGCFDGAFLDNLEPTWKRCGIEMNAAAAQRAAARGITILGEDISLLDTLDCQFDVIVAFDLIEHVVDPRALLFQIGRHLRVGGAAVIGSGNTQAPSWQHVQNRYWYCANPEHLSFIGEDWCRAVASDLELNIDLLQRYSHCPTAPLWQKCYEWAANTLYRFLPGLFKWLRIAGFGDKDAARDSRLSMYPPVWPTAQDHILAIFRKR